MRRFFSALLLLPIVSFAQGPSQPDAAQIKLKMMKLNFLGSVLYVAAHPDDENTRIITYMSNGKLAATAYLSMTRGDGGQNLIGPEIRDELGLIRTREMLAARKIDGGQQFFTRANDFGYSKSATEAFKIWGKKEILSDVVRVYRLFQPDIVLTRFPPDERAGHGHHIASAILAHEAFDLAGKRDAFPEQVGELGTWTPKRIYTNAGRWWNTSLNEHTPGIIVVNVGTYNALLGKSYSEIAAISRSQHKSQGFGSTGTRGEQLELFEYVGGDRGDHDLFDGVDTTWLRLKGGDKVKPLIEKAIKDFDTDHPSNSVPALLQIKKEILKLEKSVWKERKLKEVNQLIEDCLGLYCETTADRFYVAPGERVGVNFEIVNRSDKGVRLQSIHSADLHFDSLLNTPLKDNDELILKSLLTVDAGTDYSDPYWLHEPHGTGIFTVDKPSLIGLPENPPAVSFTFTFSVGDETFDIERSLAYRWTDPVKGEQYRPFEVVPPVDVTVSNGVWIFNNEDAKEMGVIVRSHSQSPLNGKVMLNLPAGWKSTPAEIPFELKNDGDEVAKSFSVTPPPNESVGSARAEVTIDGKSYDRGLKTISYDHFPIQTLLPKSSSKIVRLNIHKQGNLIGYVRGVGDDVPAALRNIGYDVWEMRDDEVTPENLSKLDAVVVGIRALNANQRIAHFMKDLLDYAKNGGTLVMQYNKSFDLECDSFAPYALQLSRDRVSEEDAKVTLLAADHPILNTPNKITEKDFDGWVQERGLYFPDQWDPAFTPILSMHDEGESPKDGSILVAKYGSGYYIYTSLSFFRELPEGVPGAYKLFTNIVSLGNSKKPKAVKLSNGSH
jgi:LmbE family N-acetylglucosaminyl deacetylase